VNVERPAARQKSVEKKNRKKLQRTVEKHKKFRPDVNVQRPAAQQKSVEKRDRKNCKGLSKNIKNFAPM